MHKINLFVLLILLFAIIAVLSSCGGGEGNLALSSTPTTNWIPSDDVYYRQTIVEVIFQFLKWKEEIGFKDAASMTVKWLNGELNTPPIPGNVIHASLGYENNQTDSPTYIEIYFANGSWRMVDIVEWDIPTEEIIQYQNLNYSPEAESLAFSLPSISSKEHKKAETFPSPHILVLAPMDWQCHNSLKQLGVKTFQWDIVEKLRNHGCKIDAFRTVLGKGLDAKIDPYQFDSNGNLISSSAYIKYSIKDPNYMVMPQNFEDMDKVDENGTGYYGIITVVTHYDEFMTNINNINVKYYGLDCGFICKEVNDWIALHEKEEYIPGSGGIWFIRTRLMTIKGKPYLSDEIFLNSNFFNGQDVSNSLVFMNCCNSWEQFLRTAIACQGVVYLGYDRSANIKWSEETLYKFFSFLIGDENVSPMSIGKAYNQLISDGCIPDPNEHTEDPSQNGCVLNIQPASDQLMETYLPASVEIYVQKSIANKNTK